MRRRSIRRGSPAWLLVVFLGLVQVGAAEARCWLEPNTKEQIAAPELSSEPPVLAMLLDSLQGFWARASVLIDPNGYSTENRRLDHRETSED